MRIKSEKIALVLLLSFFSFSLVSAASLSFSKVSGGEKIVLDIVVDDITDLYGLQFNIAYDANILEFVDMGDGDFLEQDGINIFSVSPNTETEGLVKNYAMTRIATDRGVTGSGVIAQIEFKPKTSGTATVSLLDTQLYDSKIKAIDHITSQITVSTFENPAPSASEVSEFGYLYGIVLVVLIILVVIVILLVLKKSMSN